MMNKKDHFVVGFNRNISTSSSKGDENLVGSSQWSEIKHDEAIKYEEKATGRAKKARLDLKKHWKRFWCCYLVATVIFLAIFLPVL